MQGLELYDPDGFVFCTRNGTPMTLNNLRRAFRQLCQRAGLGSDWTTYELRHSFVWLVSDKLDDLLKVTDLERPLRHERRRATATPSDRRFRTQLRPGTACSIVRQPSPDDDHRRELD